jgi:hypothetical protein
LYGADGLDDGWAVAEPMDKDKLRQEFEYRTKLKKQLEEQTKITSKVDELLIRVK